MATNFTFTIVKPDAVRNGHIGSMLNKITESGFRIVAMKMIRMSRAQAERFYAVHKEKGFFRDLVEFMVSGPVVVAMLQKENAVADYRKLMGATNPANAESGTLRAMFAESMQNNAVHGSDSDENAELESSFFFSDFDRFWE